MRRSFKRPAEKQPDIIVPHQSVFQPQIKVLAHVNINGRAAPGIRYVIHAGKVGFVDEPTAREWEAKGFVSILEGKVRPVSDDEKAEMMKKDHVVSMETANG